MLRGIAVAVLVFILTACHIRTNDATNTPFPTPDIPRVSFLFPENRSTVLDGTDLGVQILAEDSGAGVARVELLVDDFSVGEAKPQVSAAVPVFNAILHWMAQGIGKHSLTAVAYREDDTASAPATIIIEVVARSP
jgi:Big-like domain-containing protein